MAQPLINPQNYNFLLTKTIDTLLNSQATDTSSSISTLYKLIQSKANPPLESIWVYSKLAFSSKKFGKDKFLDWVSGLNDLFQLVCVFSASCDSSKSIVLLAPVIYEVYGVIIDFKSKGEDLGSKRERKLTRKIESLVNSILGFISVCCSGNGDGGSGLAEDEFIWPLDDLIRLWIGNGDAEDLEEKEMFKLFFPVVGGEVVGGGVSEVAGAVIAEAFLLRLSFDLLSGVSEQELRAWAVGSIAGFRNFYLFETLVRMLLGQSLPVTSLLSSENEVTLRKVLFDAVILVEYSFLNPENMIHLSAKRVLSLSISRVLVIHEATELFRKNEDHAKALSYINAFSSSRLPSQLVKAVSNKVSKETEADQPKGMSPKAILKWLRNLEDQGFRVLDDSILNLRSRLVFDTSEAENKISEYNSLGKHSDPDLMFYIDNKGAVEYENANEDNRGTDSINSAFVAAARTMKSAENGRDRKRKAPKSAEKKTRIKFQKYKLHDDSGEKPLSPGNNELSSESEVENPATEDEESEEEK